MEKLALPALGLFALVACQPVPAVEPVPDTCGAAPYAAAIGQPLASLHGLTLPTGTRILYPGDPRTEDFSAARLTIDVSEEGLILAALCG